MARILLGSTFDRCSDRLNFCLYLIELSLCLSLIVTLYSKESKSHSPKHTTSAFNFWFYSVAVITSGSDRHYICSVGHPGDPGSIPGKTFPFALSNRSEVVFGIVERKNAVMNHFFRSRVSRRMIISKLRFSAAISPCLACDICRQGCCGRCRKMPTYYSSKEFC
jgi:hypothetical protein